jgi:predicted nucleotidyltransferase
MTEAQAREILKPSDTGLQFQRMPVAPTITNHTIELGEICRRHGVRRLEIFGSATRGDFDPSNSDLDFLVDFLSDDWHGAADRWFGLIEDLESLFDRKVDLVDVGAAKNPDFLQHIRADRVELYVA